MKAAELKTAELMLAQDYVRYQKMVQAMEAELVQLPKGALVFRNVKGHAYCHLQFRDAEGKNHHQRIPPAEIQQMQQSIQRRKEVKEEIRAYQQMIQKLEKVFPELPAVAATLFSEKSTQQNTSNPYPEKPYRTAKGDYVRSKSEVIIADELYVNQIPYDYEKPLSLEGARYPVYPDFTICTPHQKQVVLWEHCGLMNDQSYRDKWERKKKLYERAGICEWKGNLISTYEATGGDLNMDVVRQHVANLAQR